MSPRRATRKKRTQPEAVEARDCQKATGWGKFSRFAAALAALVLVVCVGLGIWRWLGPRGEGPPSELSVLLITLDTTRADYLGCYGHSTIRTPHIDRLAAEGARFTQCTAAAPSTLPSHASIMTGVYPFVHGVRHNVGYRLSQANVTLAEVLERAGYSTAAYVAAFVVGRDTGLDQGFDTYSDTGTRHERRGDEVCGEAIAWLRTHAGEKFFLWVHLFDPHAPYEPPPSFRGLYAKPYEGEIAFTDEQVGRLLGELRSLKLENRTLVVLTADHGEGLGQHGESTHLYFAYDTTLSVPLVFRCPNRIPRGEVVPSQVRNVDIAPTILAFVGIEAESAMPNGQGQSLLPLMSNSEDRSDLPAYGETLGGQIALGTSALRCLRTDGWKYIHAPQPELYHVHDDPGEMHNLAASDSDRVDAMREQLRDIIAASPQPVGAGDSAVRPDSRTLDRLASLGYVTGNISPLSSDDSELDRFDPAGNDPKNHAKDFEVLGRATEALQAGRFVEAEVLYRQLVARFPDSAELRKNLARSMFVQGKLEPAIAIYRDLAKSYPADADVHYGLGKLLDRVGNRREAIECFGTAAGLDTEFAEAYYDLGVALRKEGRIAEALECFRHAVRVRPTYVDARLNLGVALAAEGKLDPAIQQYREALRIASDDAVIHFNLGNALARRGDRAEAIKAYETALRLRPELQAAQRALEAVRQASGTQDDSR